MTDQKVLSGGKTTFRIILFLSPLIFVFCLVRPASAQETALPQPYFLFPNSANCQTGSSLPIISGETQNDTTIDVYLDGQLAGHATVINGPLLTGYFTFRPIKNLAGGDHEVYVIAKDKNDIQLTSQSATAKLHIWAFPKPTLFPVTQHSNGQPIIQGVAKNDSLIKIFADNQLQATFPVANHSSGTAVFSWTALSGKTFTATATDPEGKESSLSNLTGPGQPTAKPAAKPITKTEPAAVKTPTESEVGAAPAENDINMFGEKPAAATAKTFNKKSFYLWGLLAIIAITIAVWLRKNLKSKLSGEIISQEVNSEIKINPPAASQEPQLNLPTETPPEKPTAAPIVPPPTDDKNQSGLWQ